MDQHGFRSSTPLVEIDPMSLGLPKRARQVPDYDGCVEWGDFEESQMAFLARHTRSGQTRWVPDVSSDAYAGRAAAIVKPGTTELPKILSTALIPHRFSCHMKAVSPTEAVVQIADKQLQRTIGTDWTEIAIEHTPSQNIIGEIPASITIPSGSTVLVDAISFHPMN